MFYIIFFFISLHAAFEENLAIISQKPWLLKKLIAPGQVAVALKEQTDFDIHNDIFDYQVFNKQLRVVTKKPSHKFEFHDLVLKPELPSVVDLPKRNDQIFLSSYNEFIYKNGSLLKIVGREYAGVIHIPYYADYVFKAVVLVQNFLFVLDDCGYVSCLKLQIRRAKPWLNFFGFGNSDEDVITEQFFEELNVSYFFEKGAWLQTRGIGLSSSCDKKHLYLHTIDNRIIASMIFGPMESCWSACYYQYPCELVKSNDIDTYDLIMPNPVYEGTGGLKLDIVFGSPKKSINSMYKSFIRLKNRPIRQILFLLFVCTTFYIFKYKFMSRKI